MATTAERQRAYRQRHLSDGTASRLDVLLNSHAADALERLARHAGTSKREILESLLIDAEVVVLDRLPDGASVDAYLQPCNS
ncbi:MAG: hypothetical protein KDI51_01390 [Xanthomonadales bacterium]|nr:hypothetical protein [Xanthomonadales bacterium]MCB1633207.1 hypothetical protein [Xanthomonadales bacterium]